MSRDDDNEDSQSNDEMYENIMRTHEIVKKLSPEEQLKIIRCGQTMLKQSVSYKPKAADKKVEKDNRAKSKAKSKHSDHAHSKSHEHSA